MGSYVDRNAFGIRVAGSSRCAAFDAEEQSDLLDAFGGDDGWYVICDGLWVRKGQTGLRRLVLIICIPAEGSWDAVMNLIGQAHSMLHEKGIVRIQTDIRVGSRYVLREVIGWA